MSGRDAEWVESQKPKLIIKPGDLQLPVSRSTWPIIFHGLGKLITPILKKPMKLSGSALSIDPSTLLARKWLMKTICRKTR